MTIGHTVEGDLLAIKFNIENWYARIALGSVLPVSIKEGIKVLNTFSL